MMIIIISSHSTWPSIPAIMSFTSSVSPPPRATFWWISCHLLHLLLLLHPYHGHHHHNSYWPWPPSATIAIMIIIIILIIITLSYRWMNFQWNLCPPPPPRQPWPPWPRSSWCGRSTRSWSQNNPSTQAHIATETPWWYHFHFFLNDLICGNFFGVSCCLFVISCHLTPSKASRWPERVSQSLFARGTSVHTAAAEKGNYLKKIRKSVEPA